MKPLYLLALPVLAAFAMVGCGGDESDSADKKTSDRSASGATAEAASETEGAGKGQYQVKSGVFVSGIDFMGEQTVTTYFDDYGAKQATVTVVEVMGTKSETVQITADGWVYSYDPEKKEGTKMKMLTSAGAAAAMPDIAALTDEMKKEMKFEELDTRTIAGKEATGMKLEAMGMPMKTWIWKGIPMRTEVEMGGKKPMVTEVKSVEVDVPVPAERFVVPADIKITEIGK